MIDVLTDLFILRGVPGHLRFDNGPEFIATAVRDWISAVGAETAFIEPGSPWENGYCESFNSKLRDELLNGRIFYSLAEACVVIDAWRVHYNTARPHSSLGYRPPAPQAMQWPPRSDGSRRSCIKAETGSLDRGRPIPLGRALWRRWSGYHRRSRVKTKMHCVKLLGQSLMARHFDRQVAELQVRSAVLNGYTALAIPITEAVGQVRPGKGAVRL